MRPQIDLDAGGWFIVAFIATAFGILPVLTVPLILGTGPIGDVAFLVAQGVLTAAVYAIAAALLVRARPWRRLLDLIVTLFALSVLAAVLMALVRFVANPGALLSIVKDVIPSLTFGLVQVESFAPLKLGFPDVAQYLGVAIGFAVERLILRRAGKPVGAEAAPVIKPWPLRSAPPPAN